MVFDHDSRGEVSGPLSVWTWPAPAKETIATLLKQELPYGAPAFKGAGIFEFWSPRQRC